MLSNSFDLLFSITILLAAIGIFISCIHISIYSLYSCCINLYLLTFSVIDFPVSCNTVFKNLPSLKLGSFIISEIKYFSSSSCILSIIKL